ncbi:collagen-binding protein [Bacteroidia bacterium]|nr:collagen-binding protein [Bacteroidia bacterium]
MKMRLICNVLFFLIVFSPDGKTQSPGSRIEIKGIVFELQDEKDLPVEGALAFLLNPQDSAILNHVPTGKDGLFIFSSVIKQDYLLRVNLIGYNPVYKSINPKLYPEARIDLGKIRLEENDVLLPEVTIVAEIPEVVVKEDTLEYNPAAFHMQENSVVEDLLKRLPGVEVEADGKITAVGKEIKRVFVDGKEFFGKDPKMATKNMTLDMIDKVQVVSKKSEQELLTGVEDGEEETIINLTIKKGMKKGWVTNAAVGTGGFIDNPKETGISRHAENLFISRFYDDKQITLIANSNNINNQAFADGGNQVQSNIRGRNSRGTGGNNGITSSAMAGVNITGALNEKWKMGGNIRYNYTDEMVARKGFRQNLLKDSVSYRESLSDERGYSDNLAFDYKTEFTPDSLNTFVLTTGISYNDSRSQDYSYQSTRAGDEDSTRVNLSDARTNINSHGLNINTELTYSRRFSKKGRRLSFTGNFDINSNSGEGTNISTSEFFFNPSKNKYLNQELNNSSTRNSYSFRASYVEPVWKTNNTLQFSYNIRYNRTDNIRETYDYDEDTETYSILNPDYSKSLWNHFVNQTFSMNFNAVHTKYAYNIGFNINPSYTQSTSYVKNGSSDGVDSILNKVDGRKVINYSPQLSFTYRFSKQSNLKFTYRGNTNQPSITQLDPTPNNTNPLNIRVGNPELLPSFAHNLSLQYNNSQRVSQRSLTGNLQFSFVRNEIINFTSHQDTTGIQLTMPINENGSWNTSGEILYNMPLDTKKKFKFSTQTRLNYNNRIGYVRTSTQSARNISGTLGFYENIGLSYSKDWFYGQLRGNVRYSKTTNTLEGREDQQNSTFGMTYNTQLYFPNNWILASDINYRATRGLSAGYNTNEVIWNAEISKQFLSKKQATFRIKWYDILHQTLSINRTVNANYIEDNEYNILTGYILVSFSYRLNQMGGRMNRR